MPANGWPDHAPGKFPNRGNPNSASPQRYTFRVPLKPVVAEMPARRGGWFFGVALNGVPFEAGTAETWNNNPSWRYEAHTGFLNLGLDEHNAHVYAVSRRNGVFVFEAKPGFKLVAQNKLAGDDTDFNATPALAGRQLFLRSNRNLYCTDAMQTAGAGN